MSRWRRIVDERLSSALLLSSDAVWDARIQLQLSAFRGAAQNLTNSPNQSLRNDVHPPDSPYGNDWDVLWLGHYGKNSEAFLSSTNDATEVPHALVYIAPDGRL